MSAWVYRGKEAGSLVLNSGDSGLSGSGTLRRRRWFVTQSAMQPFLPAREHLWSAYHARSWGWVTREGSQTLRVPDLWKCTASYLQEGDMTVVKGLG